MTDGVPPVEPSAAPNEDPPNRLNTLLAAAIPAAYGVLIALLVALGVQGEVLTRLLRNQPGWMGFAFGLAIVGAALPLAGLAYAGVVRATNTGSDTASLDRVTTAKTRELWLSVVGASMLLAGVIVALLAGIWTFSDREQPTLKVTSSSADDKGNAELTFDATALALSTKDTMLLRVVSVSGAVSADEANLACRTVGDIETPEGKRLSNPAVVLFLGETGPTATGAASNSATVRVTSDATYVCALAALSDSRTFGQQGGDQRFVSTLVMVENLAVD